MIFDHRHVAEVTTLSKLLLVIEEVGYGVQLQADVSGFVNLRPRSLRIGSAGRFFEGGRAGDVAARCCEQVTVGHASRSLVAGSANDRRLLGRSQAFADQVDEETLSR